jgi:hypothetical protein
MILTFIFSAISKVLSAINESITIISSVKLTELIASLMCIS